MYRSHNTFAAQNVEGNLFKILAQECMEQIYDDNPDAKFGSVAVLSFARLHHINLHYFEVELAADLADIVDKGTTTRKQLLEIRTRLRDYGAAIADYERVLKHWHQPPKEQLTAFHKTILPQRFRELIKQDRCSWDNAYIPLRSDNPRLVGFIGRVLAAVMGGLALVVPMLIMAIPGAPVKNLVTTPIAIVLVAVCIASLSQGSWRDVLGMTAAYAAVLVVFVGVDKPKCCGESG
ncbi:hypothetical protein FVEN_g8252 [Fusarium venenatum]|nr:hypothetical protein FVEN_g8252 [Fusarium venenatum]